MEARVRFPLAIPNKRIFIMCKKFDPEMRLWEAEWSDYLISAEEDKFPGCPVYLLLLKKSYEYPSLNMDDEIVPKTNHRHDVYSFSKFERWQLAIRQLCLMQPHRKDFLAFQCGPYAEIVTQVLVHVNLED